LACWVCGRSSPPSQGFQRPSFDCLDSKDFSTKVFGAGEGRKRLHKFKQIKQKKEMVGNFADHLFLDLYVIYKS